MRPRREDSELGVRFVLVGAGALDRHAGGFEFRDARLVQRVAVADPAIDGQAERRGMARPTVGGDDPGARLEPARPGRVECGPRADLSIGEDDHLHGPIVTARRLGPDARLRPCPTPPTTRPSAASSTPPTARA